MSNASFDNTRARISAQAKSYSLTVPSDFMNMVFGNFMFIDRTSPDRYNRTVLITGYSVYIAAPAGVSTTDVPIFPSSSVGYLRLFKTSFEKSSTIALTGYGQLNTLTTGFSSIYGAFTSTGAAPDLGGVDVSSIDLSPVYYDIDINPFIVNFSDDDTYYYGLGIQYLPLPSKMGLLSEHQLSFSINYQEFIT